MFREDEDGFGDYEDEYDYHCYSCGKGYYNEVGWGPITCNHCGGSINKPREERVITDEEYAETMLEFALSMDSSETLIEDEEMNLKAVEELIDKQIEKLKQFKKEVSNARRFRRV